MAIPTGQSDSAELLKNLVQIFAMKKTPSDLRTSDDSWRFPHFWVKHELFGRSDFRPPWLQFGAVVVCSSQAFVADPHVSWQISSVGNETTKQDESSMKKHILAGILGMPNSSSPKTTDSSLCQRGENRA